jgi:hypothetical protein
MSIRDHDRGTSGGVNKGIDPRGKSAAFGKARLSEISLLENTASTDGVEPCIGFVHFRPDCMIPQRVGSCGTAESESQPASVAGRLGLV